MRRVILAAAVLLLLTGCNQSRGDLEDVAAAREQCHELGGVFTVHQTVEIRDYIWECDLSDKGTP